jgi:Helix-turn-helix domain
MNSAQHSRQAESRQKEAPNASLPRVLSHPLRARALTALTEGVASPNELARRFRVSLGDAAYHVGQLVKMGKVELVRTLPRRGAVEHFYRAVVRPMLSDEETAARSLPERLEFAQYVAELSFADVISSLEDGTFCVRPDHHISRTPMLVDQEGWQELRDIYADVIDRSLEVEAATAERMTRNPDAEKIPVVALAFLFERALGPISRARPNE